MKIDKNIQMPPTPSRALTTDGYDIWGKMAVGDSFFIEEPNPLKIISARSGMYTKLKRFKGRTKRDKWKFESRIVPNGVRFWRTL